MYDGGKNGRRQPDSLLSQAANCPPNAHPNPQFMYVLPSDVQPYFALAEQYTRSETACFRPTKGSQLPGTSVLIISGTSAPTPTSTLFAAENPKLSPAGCIAALTNTVTMIDATGSETNSPPEYPCFDHPTLTDFLDTAGITWRYYAPSAGSIWIPGPTPLNTSASSRPSMACSPAPDPIGGTM